MLTIPPNSGYRLDGAQSLKTPTVLVPWWRVPDPLPRETTGYSPFTIEFWVWGLGISSNGGVISTITLGEIWSSNGINIYLRSIPGEQIAFNIDGTYLRLGDLTPEAWAHISCVYTGTEMRLYKDSALLGSTTKTGTNDPGNTEFTGQYNTDNDPPAAAEVANLRFWDHARTESQVGQDMVTDYDDTEPGLLAAYRLDSGQSVEASQVGSDEADLILNDATVTTTPVPVIVGVINPPSTITSVDVSASRSEEPRPDYPGQISGVVTVKGDPAAQRVIALERSSGKKVAETTSASDGTYTLTGLDPEVSHVIVALDKNLEYNGVIADNITPEVP